MLRWFDILMFNYYYYYYYCCCCCCYWCCYWCCCCFWYKLSLKLNLFSFLHFSWLLFLHTIMFFDCLAFVWRRFAWLSPNIVLVALSMNCCTDQSRTKTWADRLLIDVLSTQHLDWWVFTHCDIQNWSISTFLLNIFIVVCFFFTIFVITKIVSFACQWRCSSRHCVS